MQDDLFTIPNQVTTDAKMNEILEKQKILMKKQHQNNLLLLSQNPIIAEKTREVATADALALIPETKLVNSELINLSVEDWYRIKKSIAEPDPFDEERKIGK